MHMIDRLSALGQKPSVRIGYYLALVGILVLALLPQQGGQGFPHADKLMHCLLFLLITIAGRILHRGVPTVLLGLALLGYGGFMELLQGMTTWRMASAADLLADGLGIVAGMAIVRFIFRSSL